MKEHLHLFTPVNEWLYKENWEGFAITANERLIGVMTERGNFWNHENTNELAIVTHVLDLSALTTKHKAADAIEEATKEAYENCEWIYERDAVVKKWIDWL